LDTFEASFVLRVLLSKVYTRLGEDVLRKISLFYFPNNEFHDNSVSSH